MTIAFKTPPHPKCGLPMQSYVYRDAQGAPVLVANRYERQGGGKFFLPFDVVRGEWKAPAMRPLYNLDQLMNADPARPVIFVEGEKCADALADLGFLTSTTFGGSNGASKSDLSPLAGRKVIIWPDYDDAGQKYAKALKAMLFNDFATQATSVNICTETITKARKSMESRDLFAGWDAADAVSQGWSRTNVEKLIETMKKHEFAQIEITEKSAKIDKNQQISELWHSPEKETFATISLDGHHEHWPLESMHFRDFLSYEHFQNEGKMLSQSALEDQRRALQGQARFGGDEHPVFNRIGELGRTLYLDLGTPQWNAVAVTSEGWQVVDHPPARFRRAASQKALPVPMNGHGDIDLLRPFVNVRTEDDFRMIVAWLIGCFHPRGPYPILILNGEQGSAKSTTARVLRCLIDPANPIARSAPNSEQDLVISARNNHVLAFDNLSLVKPALADAFCRIATGGGFGTRKLHTDQEEVLFSATRPCLLNGIPDLATRPDMADRAIVVSLPVIASTERKFEGEFNKAFEVAAPRILAGLLDAVSTALQNLGSVSLPERPRMADFAKWVTAAEPALAWPEGAFLASYAANRQSADQASVENNPVALAILKMTHEQVRWSGTMTELRTTLQNRYPRLTDDPIGFPKQENKLSSAIRRLQPPLRRMGVSITFDRQGKSGERVLNIERA